MTYIPMLSILLLLAFLAPDPTLYVWAWRQAPYEMDSAAASSWQINSEHGQTSCSMDEPGATDGYVRCGETMPLDEPMSGGFPVHSPVAILDAP